MKSRRFGATGLRVPEIVFGGGRVGGILIYGDDRLGRAAVRRALDAGIDWFDTAASYGQGRSEQALGRLLADIEERPRVSTKVTVDAARRDLAGQVEASLARSLARLGRDRVDLLQLHNHIEAEAGGRAVGVDDVLGPGGVADGLDRVRGHGLVGHVGMTALGDAAACRRVIESGRFDSAQVYYNMLNPSAGRAMPPAWTGHDFAGVLDACRDAGMAVMAVRVFAAGYLATDVRHGRESVLTENTEPDSEQRKAAAVSAALGEGCGSRAQAAVRFVLGDARVSCAVVGVAEPAHLDEAAAAVDLGPLPGDAMARLEALYATDFGRV